MPWQSELLEQVQEYAQRQPSVSELWVFGSALHPELLDRWSDLDVGLVLSHAVDLDPLITAIGEIWTVDETIEEDGSTHRLILTDGRRLDLVVADRAGLADKGGRRVEGPSTDSGNGEDRPARRTVVPRINISLPPIADDVFQARSLAGLAAVKLGRGDQLIGTHLALEFTQLCLVQAMVLRDRDEGRNSHRFGTHRDDLAEQILQASRRTVGPEWLEVLMETADEFDRLRIELDPTYQPDWSGLHALVNAGA